MKVVAIIPARGGSKGLPGKNIRPLFGKPLIAWTIEQAQHSKYIDEIFVSTDDSDIASVAKNYGINIPFLRPKHLALDDSPTIDLINHTLEWFKDMGAFFDIVVLLEPTSPLRKKTDIDDAVRLFLQKATYYDSLVSVGEVHMEKPHIQKSIQNNLVTPFINSKEIKYYQRQQIPVTYFPYGVIYLSKTHSLIESQSFYQEKTMAYYIERWQNYEIDDIFDFLCVEAILKHQINEVQI